MVKVIWKKKQLIKRGDDTLNSMFNIYYINHEKASEISMLFDNEIIEKITRIRNTDYGIAGNAEVKPGKFKIIPGLGQYLPSFDFNGKASYNRANKVEDTVKVVRSKSIILKPIYDKAKEVKELKEKDIGNIVKINDAYLSVINSDDVIAIKALMSGIVSQVPVEGMGNMDLTSLMEVLFKGSAYIMYGKLSNNTETDDYMMLKIPMSAENEMESQYSISDIEIGKVTVIGIYRGEFERKDIERKINRMMELEGSDDTNNNEKDINLGQYMDIEDGTIIDENEAATTISSTQGKVHYIDVIAIVQDINI